MLARFDEGRWMALGPPLPHPTHFDVAHQVPTPIMLRFRLNSNKALQSSRLVNSVFHKAKVKEEHSHRK
jgi:hypothetical protein